MRTVTASCGDVRHKCASTRGLLTVLSIIMGVVSLVMPTSGYPTGAPNEACDPMTPSGHGVVEQTGASPYTLDLSATTLTASGSITVTIKGGATNYKGFLLQMRKVGETTRYGTFSSAPANTQLKQCTNAADAVTHKNNGDKTDLVFTWTAPSTPDSNTYEFLATVVQVKLKWWRIKSGTLSYGTTTTESPTTTEGATTAAEETTTELITTSAETTSIPTTTAEETTTESITTSAETTSIPTTTAEETTTELITTAEETTTEPITTSAETTSIPTTTTTSKPTTTAEDTTTEPITTEATTSKPTTTAEDTTTEPITTEATTSKSTTSKATTSKPPTTSAEITSKPTASEATTSKPTTTFAGSTSEITTITSPEPTSEITTTSISVDGAVTYGIRFALEQDFFPALNDPNAKQAQALKEAITIIIIRVMRDRFGDLFIEITIIKFRRGSIIVEFDIKLAPKPLGMIDAQITADIKSLTTGALSAQPIVGENGTIYTVKPGSVQVIPPTGPTTAPPKMPSQLIILLIVVFILVGLIAIVFVVLCMRNCACGGRNPFYLHRKDITGSSEAIYNGMDSIDAIYGGKGSSYASYGAKMGRVPQSLPPSHMAYRNAVSQMRHGGMYNYAASPMAGKLVLREPGPPQIYSMAPSRRYNL